MLDEKEISESELFEYFRKRIEKYNPSLNAFLTTCEISNEENKNGILNGIPFSMKDAFSTKGIKTTAGSRVLENYVPPFDATVFAKLKNSGANLIGKTNQDAWGHGSSTENSQYFTTKNPWNLGYVAGGSSGGEGASISAGLSVFGIGEDTGGSIRMPSNFCGIVGLKVTYGLVSRYGAIAYASSLDTVGPMAKSVEDIAVILEQIAGNDPFDATSTDFINPPKYTSKLKNSLVGKKIGIPKGYLEEGVDPEVSESIKNSLKIFEKFGVQIVEIDLSTTKYAIESYYLIATSETSSNLARFDGIRFGNNRESFGDEAKRRMMLGGFTLSAGYYDAYYKKAAQVRTAISNDFKKAFNEVDVIITPVSPTTAFKIGENINDPLQMYLTDVYNVSINLAGVPSLAIPSGVSNKGLPMGFQIIGKHFNEETILNFGYKFEQETDFFGVIKKGLERYKD